MTLKYNSTLCRQYSPHNYIGSQPEAHYIIHMVVPFVMLKISYYSSWNNGKTCFHKRFINDHDEFFRGDKY